MEHTAVGFTSDHGAFVGAHQLQDKGPAMYEDIYRIPFILRVPGAPAGQRRREFVSLVDLAPTFLNLVGAQVPESYVGHNLLPLVHGDPVLEWRQTITAEFHGHHFPYPQQMIRDGHYKLVVSPADVNEFYDLELDPCELTNQIADPSCEEARNNLYRVLYAHLKERGTTFIIG